jgi:hypothetical protein
MDLLRKTDEELLVHHTVQSEERTRRLLSAIKAPGNSVDEYAIEPELVVHAEDIGKVTRKARRIVD